MSLQCLALVYLSTCMKICDISLEMHHHEGIEFHHIVTDLFCHLCKNVFISCHQSGSSANDRGTNVFITKPVCLLNFYLNTVWVFLTEKKKKRKKTWNTYSMENYFCALDNVVLTCQLPFAFMFKLPGLRLDSHVSRSVTYVMWEIFLF